MVRAVGEEDFQPRIGFKTRYGMVSNPFADVDNMNTRDGLAMTVLTNTTVSSEWTTSSLNNKNDSGNNWAYSPALFLSVRTTQNLQCKLFICFQPHLTF